MIEPKLETMNTLPAYHGAFDYSELALLGLSSDALIDFSVNSNPYGPPPGVREAIVRVPLDRYPDRECLELRQRLADVHRVSIENIVVGNGTSELLQLIAFAFLERGAPVLIPEVTFSEYERAARLMGANVSRWHPSKQDGRLKLDGACMVFICNPNNPDGTWIPPKDIRHLAAQNPQTLFVVDEAYSNFLKAPETVIGSNCPNIVVVRSLTKDYALAGLRLGYIVGNAELIEAVRRVCPPWNVNALAQAAGVVVSNAADWLRETVTKLHENKRELIDGLRLMRMNPLPSVTHYFLLEVGNSTQFRAKLLKYKMMVRDCTSFGLPQYVRIATRTPQDNNRLLDAIGRVRV